jgi:2-keto-4-pentenoate hydratase/2-oxohepta-3-ene-1,7-dioic acid hydratase in catechol pathway
MRFSRLRRNGRIDLVVEKDGSYALVADLLNSGKRSVELKDIFNQLPKIKEKLGSGNFSYVDSSNSEYASVIDGSGKIVCVGLNYLSHIKETGKQIPSFPVLFSKFNNSLAGHMDKIRIPYPDLKIDYEGELGVMIGKTAYKVGEDFEKYIFGYFIGNDISSRELQFRTSQYLLGKTMDGFYPNGPAIVTKDEIENPQDLDIITKLNGEVRQNSNTSSMIFSIGKLISYISHYLTLEPGDIISTGTPEGVIEGMPDKDKKWLSQGDVVEVQIENIGKLSNTFV